LPTSILHQLLRQILLGHREGNFHISGEIINQRFTLFDVACSKYLIVAGIDISASLGWNCLCCIFFLKHDLFHIAIVLLHF